MGMFITLLTLIPIVFVGLASGLGLRLGVGMLVVGAIGWCTSVIARLPLIAFLSRMGRGKWGIWLSGPAEEITRLIVVLTGVQSVADAYAVGLGWGLIEIPYTVAETLMLHHLNARGSTGHAISSTAIGVGIDQLIAHPWSAWRALERYAATAIHIGMTLLILWEPILVAATIPGHSLMNIGFLRLAKRSVALAELAALGIASILLSAGLLATGITVPAFKIPGS